MMDCFINIGFGNYVSNAKIVSILSPDSAPIKRMITEGKERGAVVDASFGRSTKSVILTTSNHIILSALSPSELSAQINSQNNGDGGCSE